MFFNEFRKIVQDYCREESLVFPSKKLYKELHREYESSLYTAPVEDNDITAGQFLDSIPTERFMKINLVNQPYPTANVCVAKCDTFCAFAPACEAPKKSRFGAKVCNQEKEVEQQMTTYNEIEASRKYLLGRVQQVYWSKRDELATQFRIHASEIPRTYKELIDAIKNDKYTIDAKRAAKVDAAVANADDDESYFGFSFIDGIKFNLPTAPDHDGYTAALNELEKKLTAAKDVINTADAASGLKALQELEAWTPSTKAN